ncbi:DUF6226 family protein [Brachybacterium aquaticum]|uniref:Uncharacterized protein n=1 Tax=Brachybacterium aquaticum TaxID=1432564 RepID=A0A841AFU1_9MICO|nr:DUF6226 family protein [Brachybacterium aquaticum]MBB5832471.1 hypothetical protein [Brachybacterium aquaticum]
MTDDPKASDVSASAAQPRASDPPAPYLGTSLWWEEEQAFAEDAAGRSDDLWGLWGPGPAPFTPEILALLSDVETAFARTGADTPPWPDPHLLPDGSSGSPEEAEYSRCLDPEKYRILGARAAAWTVVLTARGWAVAEEGVPAGSSVDVWAAPPHAGTAAATVLRPRRPEASPLVLAVTGPELPGLVVGVGEPALAVLETPDCGCDACDDGSASMLRELDEILLSVVDGSLEAHRSPTAHGVRTSFGSSEGSGEDTGGPSVRVRAAAWVEDWTPRDLQQPF